MSQSEFLDLIIIDEDQEAVERLVGQLKDQGLIVRHKSIHNELELRRELSGESPQLLMVNCAYSQLPLFRVAELALHSGVELPIIAVDPEKFCDKAALDALKNGACSYGRRENPAYLAKLIEQQLEISETWTMISNYQGQISELETQVNSELQATETPIAYLMDGIIHKANQGFLSALEGNGDLSGYPVAEFIQRSNNIDFMRTLRRAMRGEPLHSGQLDDIVITLPSGKFLTGHAELKAATIDGDKCTQLILSSLSDASAGTLADSNGESGATVDLQALPKTNVIDVADLDAPDIAAVAIHPEEEAENVVSINDMDLDKMLADSLVTPAVETAAFSEDQASIDQSAEKPAAMPAPAPPISTVKPEAAASSGTIARPATATVSKDNSSSSANDEVVPDNDLSKLIDQAIAAKTISPEWRKGTVLHGASVSQLSKLSIRIADQDGAAWLLDRADHDLPERQMLQLDQWTVRQALRASNSENGQGDWLVPLSPMAMRPRFVKWLNGKLDGRNSDEGRRIVFCISERSLVNDEDGFHSLGDVARNHQCGVSLEEIRDAAHCGHMLTLLEQEERYPTEYLTLNSEILLSGCEGLQQLLDYCSKHYVITLADKPTSTDAFAQLWTVGVNFVLGGSSEDATIVEVENAFDAAAGVSNQSNS